MIVKTKFYCKSGAQEAAGGEVHNPPGIDLSNITWVDIFIEGKWYEGEYETWSSESGFRLNSGWRRYWAINENGIKMQMSKARMNTIFELDEVKLRDIKIDNILN